MGELFGIILGIIAFIIFCLGLLYCIVWIVRKAWEKGGE